MRFPAPIQTNSGAHPASCTGSFPGVKAAGAWCWPHPHLVSRLRKSWAIPPLTLWVLQGLLQGDLYLLRCFTIILAVVLYGCGTWSLTLREEHRVRVFENKVLRRIFQPKRDKVTREWRKLHNEAINDLNASPNIIRVIKSRRMR